MNVRGRPLTHSTPDWCGPSLGSSRSSTRPSTTPTSNRATSRAIRPECGRTVASTPTPPSGRSWHLRRLGKSSVLGSSSTSLTPCTTATTRLGARYKVEPYVVAADVYTNPQHEGRGGWTWYTGAAGWMYRLIVESLLGLRLEVDRLRIEPLMPATWPAYDIHYRHRNTVYHIHFRNLGGGGRVVRRIALDGVEQPDKTIPLRDNGGEHHAEVEVGGSG